ncbi:uncharacterized protein LOC133351075 [Lethenteron reissneri]|uniref:uncharacterized protein LOC133351075 n=1 Tax=Lethenteron reissneri TaxID=7753 RepID=UPI002AB7C0C0|nr:uncharacterized protein LOC133351075 [Lethenteron reissneri]
MRDPNGQCVSWRGTHCTNIGQRTTAIEINACLWIKGNGVLLASVFELVQGLSLSSGCYHVLLFGMRSHDSLRKLGDAVPEEAYRTWSETSDLIPNNTRTSCRTEDLVEPLLHSTRRDGRPRNTVGEELSTLRSGGRSLVLTGGSLCECSPAPRCLRTDAAGAARSPGWGCCTRGGRRRRPVARPGPQPSRQRGGPHGRGRRLPRAPSPTGPGPAGSGVRGNAGVEITTRDRTPCCRMCSRVVLCASPIRRVPRWRDVNSLAWCTGGRGFELNPDACMFGVCVFSLWSRGFFSRSFGFSLRI